MAKMKKSSKKRSDGTPGLVAIIGWREWVTLPELGIPPIKAKVDTGARSSSLHAFNVEVFRRRGAEHVRFEVHPLQRSARGAITVETELIEYRNVISSNGHSSRRPVIATEIELAFQRWRVELTLANRDDMGFRMLLGRQAIRGRFLVDSHRSFCCGTPPSTSALRKKTPS